MKNFITALFLLIATSLASTAAAINVKKETVIYNGDKGGPRTMVNEPIIKADITNGVLTSFFSHYTGEIQVYIYDNNGIVVSSDNLMVNVALTHTTNLNNLDEGTYIVHYLVGDVEFVGVFSLME